MWISRLESAINLKARSFELIRFRCCVNNHWFVSIRSVTSDISHFAWQQRTNICSVCVLMEKSHILCRVFVWLLSHTFLLVMWHFCSVLTLLTSMAKNESAIFTVGISNHLFLIWRKTVCKFTFDSCFDMWVQFGQSTKQSIDSSVFLRRWGTINQWYLTVIHWNMCISSFILINEYFRLAFAYCMVGSNLLDFWQKFQL